MSVKVFIDGSSGTTGLRIADRLAARPDIELLSISAEGRKDVNERAKVINSADLAFLCLPDAASKEVMPLLRPDVKVLDSGMFACIYLDCYDDEIPCAQRLLAHCREQGWHVCGDYICEVLTEFNVFDGDQRSMFLRLQAPVKFQNEPTQPDLA